MASVDLASWLLGKEDLIQVVDIGALDIGETAPYEKLVKAGRARVVGFEPDQQECVRLNQRYGASHAFYPYFIGDGKDATFHETNFAMTGSLFKPNQALLEKFQNLHELMTLRATHPVHTKRLDDINAVGDADFIKIDVQGAELAVFQGGRNVVQNAVLVWTEVEFVEMYENQPLFADVDRELRSLGYQFHTFCGFGNRCFKPLVVNNDINRGLLQHLWSDAIYVRDWMKFDAVPVIKLKKLAVLLHEVVCSYDLCHVVLTAIDSRSGSNFAARYLQALFPAPAK